MTYSLYDKKWQKQYLDHATVFVMKYLHQIGHPILPSEYYSLLDDYESLQPGTKQMLDTTPVDLPVFLKSLHEQHENSNTVVYA